MQGAATLNLAIDFDRIEDLIVVECLEIETVPDRETAGSRIDRRKSDIGIGITHLSHRRMGRTVG